MRGTIPPSEFIPIAEECGAILPIGEWVLREACREAATWGNDYKIAVNLSPVQLGNADVADLVQRVLVETGLSPHRLELEITESTIIGDKERALHTLRRIKAFGVTIAIDDFGTGYSSLETLRAFPFDKIKLDRSFMSEVEASPEAKAIIRAILALGQTLRVPVLAEGVETRNQLDILLDGKLIGSTEIEKLMLKPGRHKLDLENESLGYRGSVEVRVRPGATTSVSVVPKTPVTVEAPAGTELSINGENMGTLPNATLEVPLGTAEFVMRYKDEERRHVVPVTMSTPIVSFVKLSGEVGMLMAAPIVL